MPLFGTEGERIGYEVHGGPSGAPELVLIHGFTASSASFVSNLPGLAGRFRVITVELLGHGASDAPEELAAYGPDAAVARLVALFDHLGLDRPLVCGHSLGGALGLRLALDHPDRVSGLLVINSNSAAGTPEWRETARASMEAMAARVRAEGTAFMRSTRLYPGQSKRLPPGARSLLTLDFERLQPAGIAGTAEGLTIAVNSFERLGELQTPALVVIGDRDLDFVQNAPRFLARLPRDLVETFTIQGAGHAANLEQPELFNEALFAFAERIGYLSVLADPKQLTALEPTAGHGVRDSSVSPEQHDDLGPTLYSEAVAGLRGRGRQAVLAAAGSVLILSGAALLVAAFFVGGDGDDEGRVAASADATRTPTPVEQSAGVRTAAAWTPTPIAPTAALATPQGETPAAAEATTTPAPAATPIPIATVTPTGEPAATATPSPTSVPAAAATPTPSGPSISISGPSTGQPGAPLTFAAAESPAAIRRDWSASNGAFAAHASTFTVTFAGAGCHTVTLTAIFPGGIIRIASRTVAVGVDSCG